MHNVIRVIKMREKFYRSAMTAWLLNYPGKSIPNFKDHRTERLVGFDGIWTKSCAIRI